ncbi:MAG TPA: RagB/SusD family nutrient uptake outer membrane protein [Chitinophagaceae bacterium]|nr:RagB/SusD family nutrient uptake outer membrane protein [Chitinophagaceae bacterium]
MRLLTNISFALLLLVSFASCKKDDVVDLEPIDLIPSERAFLTFNDITTGLNGVYGTWQARRSTHLTSFITDEVRLGTGTSYRNIGNILFNFQYVSDAQDFRDTETGGVFTNLYQVIDRANRVLELMVPVPTTSAAEAALKNQYRGELLGLRALAHLELLRWYAATVQYSPDAPGIVIQSEYVKSVSTYFPGRSKQSEVVTFINKDLDEAKTLIPTSFTDISRLTRNAITASQVRVAQHTGNWQIVVDRATEVLASQPITPRASYAALWTTRTLASNQSTEVIWKLNVQQANLGLAVGSLFQDLNGAVQAAPSLKLINSYDKVNDIRYPTFFTAPTTAAPTGLIAKYGAVVGSNNENFQYDIKMIRSSEILLARAEAYAELNQFTPANADLALLRNNRISGYSHVAITNKQALIDEILLERYRELAYEGQRYHDLRRRSLPISRNAADIGGISTSQTLLSTDAKYLLPIPQQETFANPNIGQNPGY